jgi:hypothetical protein
MGIGIAESGGAGEIVGIQVPPISFFAECMMRGCGARAAISIRPSTTFRAALGDHLRPQRWYCASQRTRSMLGRRPSRQTNPFFLGEVSALDGPDESLERDAGLIAEREQAHHVAFVSHRLESRFCCFILTSGLFFAPIEPSGSVPSHRI